MAQENIECKFSLKLTQVLDGFETGKTVSMVSGMVEKGSVNWKRIVFDDKDVKQVGEEKVI